MYAIYRSLFQVLMIFYQKCQKERPCGNRKNAFTLRYSGAILESRLKA